MHCLNPALIPVSTLPREPSMVLEAFIFESASSSVFLPAPRYRITDPRQIVRLRLTALAETESLARLLFGDALCGGATVLFIHLPGDTITDWWK